MVVFLLEPVELLLLEPEELPEELPELLLDESPSDEVLSEAV
jgi:hypothetical protein